MTMPFSVLVTKPMAHCRPVGFTEYLQNADFSVGPDAPRCHHCGKALGMLPWLPPYVVDLETWGREFGDFVAGPHTDLLISEHAREVIERETLTGLTGFDAVEIRRVRKHARFSGSVPRYYRVSVIRSNALIDQAASGVEWSTPPTCPICQMGAGLKRIRRIIIRRDSWSGEGIFLVKPLPATVFVSGRFREVCESERLTNMLFIAATSYSYESGP